MATTMENEASAPLQPVDTANTIEVEGNEAINDEIASDVEENDENKEPETDVTADTSNSKMSNDAHEGVSCSPGKKRKAEETVDDQEAEETVEGSETTKENNKSSDDSPTSAESESPNEAVASELLNQPLKKARSGYFIFMDERRPEIQAKHKGEGVAAVARELGKVWKSMPDDEKAVYLEKAALEKEAAAKQREQFKAAGIKLPEKASAPNDALTQFPLSKVRITCQLALDEDDVKKISKEALLLITKCAELATDKLGTEAGRVASMQNRRTLMPEDVVQVCQSREQFLFLRDDVNDLAKQLAVQKQNEKEGTSNKSGQKLAKAISNSKPLTSYFAAKST